MGFCHIDTIGQDMRGDTQGLVVSPGCLVELACATLVVWMLGRGSLTFPARTVVWPAAPFVSVEGVCVTGWTVNSC